MGITWTQSSTLPVLCADVPANKIAHPTMVGFLAVQGAAIGGLRFEQPRVTKKINVRVELPNGVYGKGVSGVNSYGISSNGNGISGSVVQGSQMADALVATSVKASGVPPRGRPV